jgi:hypothetical protein
MKLSEIKNKLLGEIDDYSRRSNDTEYVNKKLTEARQHISEEKLEDVDDDTVTRFMLYSKLNAELTSEET